MSVLAPRSPHLVLQVLEAVGIELVVVSPEVARETYDNLVVAGKKEAVKHWHIVSPLGSEVLLPELPGDVLIEYHLFPGLPLGQKTPQMTESGEKGAVPNEDFYFEMVNGKCYITSLVPHALLVTTGNKRRE